MTITLPDLPYPYDGLAPHISEKTLRYHHDKHHKSYVDKANKQLAGSKLEGASLEDIVRESEGQNQQLFNNAAQAWNHTFYWSSMRPGGGGAPKGDIARLIDASFGSYDDFKEKFTEAGKTQFGSGWAWLVEKGGKLEVRKTPDAKTPLTDHSCRPLLTMDVWEHAYYLDYQNSRKKYIAAWLDRVVNWSFAEENLQGA